MEQNEIDAAIQRAVNKLKDEQFFECHTDDVLDMIGKSNIDAKTFAINLVQQTMYELFMDKN
ncbi:hypothetical protein [Fructobacillus cardui]|uniref:hypothetical protein n=1 Tax=Fructobacillus cardui TaxID=2893170 RepID=UPI00200B416E|nr:hypothetical protein [Fructobacillus cardui]MCK8626695.1 hypothetical protein [Fructobacillus cardui]